MASSLEESFQIKIYTPAGLLLEDETDSVSLPSIDGQIGILPQHVKYVGQLGIGIIEFVSSNSKTVKRMVISGGFSSFKDSVLTILADSIDLAEDVDLETYATDRDELNKTFNAAHSDGPEQVLALERLKRIEAIDSLISH